MATPHVTHYIFYHDESLLAKVRPTFNAPSNIEYIDLEKVELPEKLRISSLSEKDNRALFSEYLGMYTLQPESDMVGLFTYSIPYKFAKDYARSAGAFKHLFEPFISFDLLKDKSFEKDKLYGVEFSSFFQNDPGLQRILEIDAHPNFSITPVDEKNKGPFKGSVVISRERFLSFQRWFLEVTIYLLHEHGYTGGLAPGEVLNVGKHWVSQDQLAKDKAIR